MNGGQGNKERSSFDVSALHIKLRNEGHLLCLRSSVIYFINAQK